MVVVGTIMSFMFIAVKFIIKLVIKSFVVIKVNSISIDEAIKILNGNLFAF